MRSLRPRALTNRTRSKSSNATKSSITFSGTNYDSRSGFKRIAQLQWMSNVNRKWTEMEWTREKKNTQIQETKLLSNATNKIAMRKIEHRMNGCCCCCCRRRETANTENQKIMEWNIKIIKTHIDTRRQWHLAAHKSRVYSKKEYKTVGESNKNELSQLT